VQLEIGSPELLGSVSEEEERKENGISLDMKGEKKSSLSIPLTP
jgi:hypothetical protein